MKAFGEKRLKYYTQQSNHYYQKAMEYLVKAAEYSEKADEEADLIYEKREEYIHTQIRAEREAMQATLDEVTGKTASVAADQVALDRAKTYAIFDAVLFAIENWATDDSPAVDFTIVSQSILFPLVLEKVSNNNENYFLDEVPPGAVEVVRRGREYIKAYREEDGITMLDPHVFPIVQEEIKSWWTRDALGLMLGTTTPDWQTEEVYDLERIQKWRATEADRVMSFPALYDTTELVRKYGDEIRDETGIPQFTRHTMQTRITNG